MPKRIQRKGWRMPGGAVSVTRSEYFGNHYRVWRDDDGQWTVSWRCCHYTPRENTKASAAAFAVKLYRKDIVTEGPHNYRGVDPIPTHSDIIKNLRGKDLACWCGLCVAHKDGKPFGEACLDCDPCHADVLGEIANS